MKKEQKAETLFCGITNISDAVINEAASGALPAKRAPWVKWGAVAACACLLATAHLCLPGAAARIPPRCSNGRQASGRSSISNTITVERSRAVLLQSTLPQFLMRRRAAFLMHGHSLRRKA